MLHWPFPTNNSARLVVSVRGMAWAWSFWTVLVVLVTSSAWTRSTVAGNTCRRHRQLLEDAEYTILSVGTTFRKDGELEGHDITANEVAMHALCGVIKSHLLQLLELHVQEALQEDSMQCIHANPRQGHVDTVLRLRIHETGIIKHINNNLQEELHQSLPNNVAIHNQLGSLEMVVSEAMKVFGWLDPVDEASLKADDSNSNPDPNTDAASEVEQDIEAAAADDDGPSKEWQWEIAAGTSGHDINSESASDVKPSQHKYAFRAQEPNSMTFEDMEWCPSTQVADLEPVDSKLDFLFLLGAQKSGTSWLHRALIEHPLFVEANDAYLGGWKKEIRFFYTQPPGSTQDFLDCYPGGERERALAGDARVFLDSTPDYLPAPVAAPRIKKAVPHAKFIIVLRDPVARTVSAHNMKYHANDLCWRAPKGKGAQCNRGYPPLLEEFRVNRDLLFKWQEDVHGCNFNTTATDSGEQKSWGECWRCQHFVFECHLLSEEEIEAMPYCYESLVPHAPHLPLLQYGLYAAQLSWWLSFFPPERFLILRQDEIQDPAKAVPILNEILEFVGQPDAKRFKKEEVETVEGFATPYSASERSEDERLAIKEIEEFFVQPNKDLQTLMDTHFPSIGFTGLKPEYKD